MGSVVSRPNATHLREAGTMRDLIESQRQSQRSTTTAANIPINCAKMKANTPADAMPANVSDRDRAIVTAGLAKEVEAMSKGFRAAAAFREP